MPRRVGEAPHTELINNAALDGWEAFPDAAMVFDRDWRFRYVNAAYERLRGLPREALLGRVLWEVFPALAETRARATGDASMLDGQTRTIVLLDPLSLRWTEARYIPTTGGLTVVLRDVTEAHDMGAARAESDRLLRVITDAAPILKAYIGSDLRYRLMNRAYETWFGLDRRESLGRTMSEVLGEAAFDVLRPFVERALSGEVVQFERMTPYREGGHRYIHAHYVPDVRADGSIPGFVAAVVDVTRLKVAEGEVLTLNATLEARVAERTRALQQALLREHVLGAVAQSLHEAEGVEPLLSTVLEHLPVALNASLVTALVIEGDTARYAGYHGALPAAIARAVSLGTVPLTEFPTIRRVVASGRPIFVDDYTSLPTAVPGIPPVASALLPVVRRDGTVAAVLFVSRDLEHGSFNEVERGLLEQVASTVSVALDRAESRTVLERRTRELEDLTAQQESFAYTVSHDLKAPLIALDGMASLLREALQNGNLAEADFLLGRVGSNVARMQGLVDDLLTLSRVGRISDPPESLALGQAVQAALASIEPLSARRSIKFVLPDMWPTVCYPRGELDQVLANLLSNAAKWAGRADVPPVVTVGWALRDDQVVLAIDDNGTGIEPRHRERVFSLFQRLDVKAEGSGVGLAIVKRIVERHGGRVWIEDSHLGGARFLVTMPLG